MSLSDHSITLNGLIVSEQDAGILLFEGEISDASDKIFSFPTLLFKQILFQDDEQSFYGFTYEIKEIHITSSAESIIVEGVWIPHPQLHLLQSLLDEWDSRNDIQIAPTLISLFSIMKSCFNETKMETIFPSKYAIWQWENENLIKEHIESGLPTIVDEQKLIMERDELVEKVFDFFQLWLQFFVISEVPYKHWILPYFSRMKHFEKGDQLNRWLTALTEPGKSYILSEHLYPPCLKTWNGKVIDAFQLVLLLTEPEKEREPWSIELYLKEWETGYLNSVRAIYDGKHSYRKNPIPFLKIKWPEIKDHYPINKMTILEPLILLSTEETTQFLLHHAENVENSGISILVPQAIKNNQSIPSIHGNIALNTTPFSNSQGGKRKINWTFLVDDIPVEENMFKQWVEDKRQLIFLKDHWVMWNLSLAEKLLTHYQSQKDGEEFFNSLRKAITKDEKASHKNSETILDQGEISWTLHPSWREDTISEHMTLDEKWVNKLRSYQKEGVEWLLKMRSYSLGACLGDDMGLGKTIQTIAYMDTVKHQETVSSPFLIICPTSVVMNWIQEIVGFAPSMHYSIHEGKMEERRRLLPGKLANADIIVTSYPLAVRDMDLFRNHEWSGLILDEAQKLKNVSSKQRKAIKQFRSCHTIALTGTPVENEPKELWSIMDLLNPGYLKDESWFQSRFVTNKGDKLEKGRMSELQTLIRPFILRRTKKQYQKELTLPLKEEKQHTVTLSEEQLILYEAVVEQFFDQLPNATDFERRAHLFRVISKLKQICNHPAHFLKEPWSHQLKGRSGKWDDCFLLLNDLKNRDKKTLLFTQYKFMGDLIQNSLQLHWDQNIPFFHGQLSKEQRLLMINNFQNSEDIPLMIVSLRAGGFGINLTAASQVIHYDRWWNPAVENQATDRVYRIGQLKPVTVHTFLTKGTIEEKLDILIKEKLALQNQLIGQSNSPLWNFDDDELEELLEIRK
ncbi:DEAD/DEAH box helicase [Evansella tamaricis]|uniref:DEAD/DEAH box helicase n=1 Tax=Evansella tamaricis TaxID=2069301 RepID=A0ABS6JCS9_9BACI|nr:DEAD/DEAH box helicase [Evansella tamaricis]MBU9711475.1 DEAD/DEAH box helicase [Evansella tamaricis]